VDWWERESGSGRAWGRSALERECWVFAAPKMFLDFDCPIYT
jgi:hypothetical protein